MADSSNKLIRREDALDAIGEQIVMSMCLTEDECRAKRWMREVDRKFISEVPVVDAVEVVRCKDCTRSEEWNSERYCSHLRSRWNKDGPFWVDDNDFCCWGIRREPVE